MWLKKPRAVSQNQDYSPKPAANSAWILIPLIKQSHKHRLIMIPDIMVSSNHQMHVSGWVTSGEVCYKTKNKKEGEPVCASGTSFV